MALAYRPLPEIALAEVALSEIASDTLLPVRVDMGDAPLVRGAEGRGMNRWAEGRAAARPPECRGDARAIEGRGMQR